MNLRRTALLLFALTAAACSSTASEDAVTSAGAVGETSASPDASSAASDAVEACRSDVIVDTVFRFTDRPPFAEPLCFIPEAIGSSPQDPLTAALLASVEQPGSKVDLAFKESCEGSSDPRGCVKGLVSSVVRQFGALRPAGAPPLCQPTPSFPTRDDDAGAGPTQPARDPIAEELARVLREGDAVAQAITTACEAAAADAGAPDPTR